MTDGKLGEDYFSIMTDGWIEGKGRNFINVLVNNPFSTIFLK